jgi:serine/threonine-protein kinase RsbW
MHHDGKISLTIPSGLEHVWALGVTLKALCSAAGVEEETAGLMELAVVEAVNNCIEHAYGGQAGHKVEVGIELEENQVVFSIADWGAPMGELPAGNLEFNPKAVSTLPEGGMGLHIIRQIMDRVEYRFSGGKNHLVLIKYINKQKNLGKISHE